MEITQKKEDGKLQEVKFFIHLMLPGIIGPAKYQLFAEKGESDVIKIVFFFFFKQKKITILGICLYFVHLNFTRPQRNSRRSFIDLEFRPKLNES